MAPDSRSRNAPPVSEAIEAMADELYDHKHRRGFAVTHREEVGWVDFDAKGTHNPAEAAFLIIAQCQADGVYEFPGPDENTTTRVVVDWTVHDGA